MFYKIFNKIQRYFILLNDIFFKLKKIRQLSIKTNIKFSKGISLFKKARVYANTLLDNSGNGNIVLNDDVIIRENCYIFSGGGNIIIDKGSSLNFGCCLLGAGNITIGKNVLIATNVTITSSGHTFNNIDIDMKYQNDYLDKIIIKNNVWIGSNVVILPGVTIEEGCVIGAGSVVTKDISKNSIVAGVPAKIIKKRK